LQIIKLSGKYLVRIKIGGFTDMVGKQSLKKSSGGTGQFKWSDKNRWWRRIPPGLFEIQNLYEFSFSPCGRAEFTSSALL